MESSTMVALVDDYLDAGTTVECFHMNNTNTTRGGWKDSYMRNTIMSQFKNILPSDLRSNMKSVTKYTNNDGFSSDESYTTATTDYLFLMSICEGGREASSGNTVFQETYAYFLAGNSGTFSQDYNLSGVPSKRFHGWSRTPNVMSSSNADKFWAFYMESSYESISAIASKGISPCFCI